MNEPEIAIMPDQPYPLFTWVWARVMVDGEVRHLVGRVFGRSFVRRRYDVMADRLYQHIPAEDVAVMELADPPMLAIEHRPQAA